VGPIVGVQLSASRAVLLLRCSLWLVGHIRQSCDGVRLWVTAGGAPHRQLLRVITTRWAKRTASAIDGDLVGGSRLDSYVRDINRAPSLPPPRARPCFCHLRVHAQVSATISSSPSSRRGAALQLRSRLWSAPLQDLAPSC
jgi:hypothetical protein